MCVCVWKIKIYAYIYTYCLYVLEGGVRISFCNKRGFSLVEKHQTLKKGLQTAHKKGTPPHKTVTCAIMIMWFVDLFICMAMPKRDGKDQ